MKFYRVNQHSVEMNSEGFDWFLSLRDAKQCKREYDSPEYEDECEATIEVVNIPCNQEGILWALNRYANHPDNG